MPSLGPVTAVDYHTAGEPFRIVTGGVPRIPGRTVLDRRDHARRQLDSYRRLLVEEPRGHGDMYGCHVVEPDDEGAHFGVVFFHRSGYSTACGHGVIALGTWAVESGRVPAPGGATTVVIDAPSGRVAAGVRLLDGRVGSVSFRSVPAFVDRVGVPVETSAGPVTVDVAYGGAYYACLPAPQVGLGVEAGTVGDLVVLAREIKAGLARPGTDVARHPADSRLSGIYGVIFYEELPSVATALHQRNLTVFADGAVDRSPCGSGTAARLALLRAGGQLDPRGTLVHESVIGTRFAARVVAEAVSFGRPAVVAEVEGRAFRTGEHRFAVDPHDPLGPGFLLPR